MDNLNTKIITIDTKEVLNLYLNKDKVQDINHDEPIVQIEHANNGDNCNNYLKVDTDIQNDKPKSKKVTVDVDKKAILQELVALGQKGLSELESTNA